MKSFFSLLLFTVFYSNTFAQAVLTGTVNNQIHEPIPLALIQLQRSSPAWQQTMQTDSSGRFSFTGLAPGEYQLRVAFTGYQTISLSTPISRDTVIRLIMQPLNAKLNEVTVTSVKAAISNNPDKLVYNVASSITATGSDALTALSQVPVIRISDNEIGIAGKGAVKVLLSPEIRGTFLPNSIVPGQPLDFDQIAYALPLASGKALNLIDYETPKEQHKAPKK